MLQVTEALVISPCWQRQQRTEVGLSPPFQAQNALRNIIQHVTFTMTSDTIDNRMPTWMLPEVVVGE